MIKTIFIVALVLSLVQVKQIVEQKVLQSKDMMKQCGNRVAVGEGQYELGLASLNGVAVGVTYNSVWESIPVVIMGAQQQDSDGPASAQVSESSSTGFSSFLQGWDGPSQRAEESVAWAAYEEGSWEISSGERWQAGRTLSVQQQWVNVQFSPGHFDAANSVAVFAQAVNNGENADYTMTAQVSDVTKDGFKVMLALPAEQEDSDADSVTLNWVAVSVPDIDDDSYESTVWSAFNIPEYLADDEPMIEGYFAEGTFSEDAEYSTLVFVQQQTDENGAVCTGFYQDAEFDYGMLASGVGLAGDGECEGEDFASMGYIFAPPATDSETLGCAVLTEDYDLECDAATQNWASQISMDGYTGEQVCSVSVQTDGGNCGDWCADQGFECYQAQDNRGSVPSCELANNFYQQDMSNNGCNQNWTSQVCVCGVARDQ